MRCIGCSADVPEGSFRCPGCGLVQVEGEGAEKYDAREQEWRQYRHVAGRSTIYEPEFASAGQRVVAYFIDSFAVIALAVVLFTLFGHPPSEFESSPQLQAAFWSAAIGLQFAYMIGFGALMSSSPGKKLLGMTIVNERYEPIGPAHALGRELARVITNMVGLLGYLMVAVTARNQTLHDKIASTYVIDG